MTSLVEAALLHLQQGRSVLPVGYDKRPHHQALIRTGHQQANAQGRTVGAWQILQSTPATPEQCAAWFRPPGRGLGLITGRISGLVVLDADGDAGLALFEQYRLTRRAHVRTRSGGLHLYLPHPGWPVRTLQSQKNANLTHIKGLDIRADGGYVVAPPTRHPSGHYRALRDPFDLEPLDTLPDTLRDTLGLLKPPISPPQTARTTSSARTERPTTATPPPARWQARDGTPLDVELLTRALDRAHAGYGRNETGFWLACQLRDNHSLEDAARDVMLRYARQVPDWNSKSQHEPYSDAEALHSLAEAFKRVPRDPWTPPRPGPVERLKLAWPQLDDRTRDQAARCIIGARGDTREAGLRLLVLLGHDVQAALDAAEQDRRENRVLPGLAGLVRLLDRASP